MSDTESISNDDSTSTSDRDEEEEEEEDAAGPEAEEYLAAIFQYLTADGMGKYPANSSNN